MLSQLCDVWEVWRRNASHPPAFPFALRWCFYSNTDVRLVLNPQDHTNFCQRRIQLSLRKGWCLLLILTFSGNLIFFSNLSNSAPTGFFSSFFTVKADYISSSGCSNLQQLFIPFYFSYDGLSSNTKQSQRDYCYIKLFHLNKRNGETSY